jgi:hypothetical protein
MPVLFPSEAKITPNFSEPEFVVTYAQASGAFAVLPEGKPRVKIGSEDMAVYINQLDIRTDVTSGQSPSNLLPSASLTVNFAGTPTYLARTRAIWDHHDTARGGEWGLSVPAALDLGARQGIFQQMRTALLYGYNAGNGEGLLNTVGATTVALPPDSFGNTTVRTYDNGQMALWLLGEIVALKSGMYQSGGNIHNKIVVISPQREFLQFAVANIVQVTSYQRPGAGTATVADVVKVTMRETGDTFDWYFDDTLIGQGSGGADVVLLTMPEIEAPDIPGMINTNVFGSDIRPQLKAVNLMYADMAAPMKIPTPIPDGAITEIHELRITSGWGIRSAGIYILTMNY